MLDLFSGLGGASQAFRSAGWKVTCVDISLKFKPDICADLLHNPIRKNYYDFIWCSPPCIEFSRSFLPWIKNYTNPSLKLFQASLQLITEFKPKFWCIENVKGAVPWFKPYLGKYNFCINPFYFWTNVPALSKLPAHSFPGKQKFSGGDPRRALIPKVISKQFLQSIESYLY